VTVETPDPHVRVGALVWSQHTGWDELMRAGARIEEAGFDHLWSWDHVLPIAGPPVGPIFEAFMTLAGWASVTSRVALGPMVAANTFRNPAMLVKMTTTLDHMSHGRATLGLGAGWFEPEHVAFGLDLGPVGERLGRMDEAAALIRDLLDGRAATARGPHYAVRDLVNEPPPLQRHLPLLIGGAGERRTLATVARYADIWNAGGDADELRHKDSVLRDWCERVGRDQIEIERSTGVGAVVIRDSERLARPAADAIARHNAGWEGPVLCGSPETIAERLAPIVDAGFRTLYVDFPPPFDEETMRRFADEVRPALAKVGTPGR
jgi:F420-dependent oxidoreductase-like protein